MRISLKINHSAIRDRVGEKVRDLTTKIVSHVANDCISNSPVRSGAFKANWYISEGTPRYTKIDVIAGQTYNSAAPEIPKSSAEFPVYYITNGQDYANELEFGHSGQAPSGMARIAAQRAKVIFGNVL